MSPIRPPVTKPIAILMSPRSCFTVGAPAKGWRLIVGLALLAGCARFESRPISPVETAAILEARTLADPQLRSFLEKNGRRAFPAWPARSWDFETLTLVAFYFHPSLEVARAQWSVAQAGV